MILCFVQLQQIAVRAIQYQFAFLVVHAGAHGHDAGGALGCQLCDFQRGVKRVAGINRFQKFCVHLDKADQAFANDMGKKPSTGGGETQNLKPMRQRGWMAQPRTIFGVVMDRVIVQADGLKRGKVRGIDGARWRVENLADTQLRKAAKGGDAVLLGIKR